MDGRVCLVPGYVASINRDLSAGPNRGEGARGWCGCSSGPALLLVADAGLLGLLGGLCQVFGLASGLRFSRSPKHATGHTSLAIPRAAGSSLRLPNLNPQFDVPLSRPHPKTYPEHQNTPALNHSISTPLPTRSASSFAIRPRVSGNRRVVGLRASTMKELLDTDRLNFLVWRFVVFRCLPCQKNPPASFRPRYCSWNR